MEGEAPDPSVVWIKIVGMLQHNWADLQMDEAGRVTALFFDDGSHIFDRLIFPDHGDATTALKRNGFRPYANPDDRFGDFVAVPDKPLTDDPHWVRPIYSSGEFWK